MTADEMAMAVRDAVNAAVEAAVREDNLRLEGLLVEAVRLQDFDRLDDLVVLEQAGQPRTVASVVRDA